MKQFFLWAVALSALCSSCETADETFLEETNNIHNVMPIAKQQEWNDYAVYQNIVNTFVYDVQQTHQENLSRFEQHVNHLMSNYGTDVYESINFEQLGLLETAEEHFVEYLNYSVAAKEAIYKILNQSFDPEVIILLNNKKERRLIATLFVLHNNENGDDDDGDDEWKNKKTIAFAYGAQYSLIQAVLYAGAMELRRHQ